MTRPEEIRSCYSFSKQLVSSGHTQKSIHNSKNISHLEYSHAEQMLERSPRLWEKKSVYYSCWFLFQSKGDQKCKLERKFTPEGTNSCPFISVIV